MPSLLVVHPRLADLRGAEVGRYRPLLSALGLRLVLADGVPEPELAPLFDEVLELPAPHEVEAGWRVLERFLATRRIDGVLAQTESALPYGALVAERLGLPGPRARAAYLCLDKHACRRRLAQAHVAQPSFVLAHDAAEARRALRQLGLPVVLKGIASANQRLVTLVRDEAELAPAVARLREGLARSRDVQRLEGFARVAGIPLEVDPRRAFLVEAFAPGAPLESDGLVVSGELRSFGVTEQVHARAPDFFIEGYLTPADRPEEERARLEHMTAAALAAVGLDDSGYSIEFRSHAADARLIEVNGRLGCDEGFGDLFEAVLGAQPLFLAVQLALGLDPRFERRSTRAAVAYQSCYREALVRAVPEPGLLARLAAEGLRLGLNVRPGERMRRAEDPEVHPHLAFALACDAGSSRRAFARAQAAVQALAFELEEAGESAPGRSAVVPAQS